MMHYYYVVYSCDSCFGSCQVSCRKKIESIDDVDAIRKYISETWCEGNPVLIFNWKHIKKSRQIKRAVDDE